MKENFTHKVRNCKEWDSRKFSKHGCVSFKEDGVRAFYYPGESILWSRDEKPIYGMGHIVDELKMQDTGWPIDMELVVPGMEFNMLSGVIRNHQSTPEVKACVIDVVKPGTLIDRFKHRPVCFEHLTLIDHRKVTSLVQVIKWYERAILLQKEGLVWKALGASYENKRNHDWMRIVPVLSEDCEVTGVYEGQGKMAGIAGGIFINFRGLPCKCGTMKGMTYEDREELLRNKENYIGQCKAEIEYKNLQPSGLPRQPRFKGWRWDK